MSNIDRLEEIKDEMKSLLEEATRIVREETEEQKQPLIYQRATSYWMGEIALALDNESDYAGRSMCNLASTIEELRENEEEPEEE